SRSAPPRGDRVLEGPRSANGLPSWIRQLVTGRRSNRRKAGGFSALREGQSRQRERARAESLDRRGWRGFLRSPLYRRLLAEEPGQGDPRRNLEGGLARTNSRQATSKPGNAM